MERAIDELSQLDPRSLSDDELHDLTVELHKVSSRLAATRATATAEWRVRRIWADDGSRSPGARLARECGLDPRTAHREVLRARRLREMPETAGALATGSLSVDVVDLLVRANSGRARPTFARDERTLLALVRDKRFLPAKRIVAHWRMLADQDAASAHLERARDRRHAHVDRTFMGGVHVSGFLPSVEGTVFYEEFHRLERDLFAADMKAARAAHGDEWREHLPRSAGQRGADALTLMAERSRSAPEQARKPAPLFTVLVGYETFAGAICQLEDGIVIPPSEIVRHLADADIERVVFDGPSRVLEVGARRRFTGALRRAIQVRDQHCQHPSGCDEPISRAEVDHIREWEDGGPTTQENGALECGVHNRIKHRTKRRSRRTRRSAPPRGP